MKLKRRILHISAFIVFFLAFSLRLLLMFATPGRSYSLDLQIYQAGGALVAHDINPYNYDDQKPLRTRLRLESVQPWIRNKQVSWDYYASSNLPLNLLFFGLLTKIADTPLSYRVAFAFFDSILSAFVFLFVHLYWKNTSKNILAEITKWLSSLLLGALSLILLLWGTYFPEDKGIEILLILVAVMCTLSKRDFIRLYLGALFLGLSIAFKGLGIFFVPYYIAMLFGKEKLNVRKLSLVIFVLLTSTFVWFVPYLSYITSMMLLRLQHNSGGLPAHASPWISVYTALPGLWSSLRLVTVAGMGILAVAGYYVKKINLLNLSAIYLFIFTCLFMLAGSLDRMHIGILLSVLFLGALNIFAGIFLTGFYLLLGTASVLWDQGREWVESIFILLFACAYIVSVLFLILHKKPSPRTSFHSVNE